MTIKLTRREKKRRVRTLSRQLRKAIYHQHSMWGLPSDSDLRTARLNAEAIIRELREAGVLYDS